ncbi:histidine phosphatase family protein [Nonomuraea zeae]|uniref:Histidine phosphatase family protein n=1 Tax=Nonomuraea zeae TaxID=1642303 RepID=A0A5S4F8T5_9ACTN|nr:histidine phosphatase family protein [Nonomuraea zeae]TMR13124.1 histidine phosphatase family protein [Nonomuraea zeae]
MLLVRHGESEPARPDRPFPLVDGQGDPGLAPEGREHAERVALRLVAERIDAIYVSSLRRTSETAAPLAARLGLTPMVEPDLREVHLGEWEGGLFRRMVAEGHPIAKRMSDEERWDVIPGAEPAAAFSDRVRRVLGRLAATHPDQRIVVVTHGGVIAEALASATGARPFAFLGADNASVSHLVLAEGRWIVRRYNDTAHLDPAFSTTAAPPT